MKMKISLMVCTASLFVAFPIMAQAGRGSGNQGDPGDHGHHNPRGNGSDHGGDDEDGGGNGHKDKDAKGDKDKDAKGHRDLVLASPRARASVASAATSVTNALNSGSLRTSSGALIPVPAQVRTYAVLVSDHTMPASSAEMSAALSTAGPAANAIVPSLMRSVSGLGSNPVQLPSAIAEYNRFTKAASSSFIANPPAEFVALHTVLARLTAAASSAK